MRSDDDRATDDSPRPIVPMLDYSKPSDGRPPTLKQGMAIAFAVIAVLLGGLLALGAANVFARSLRETTTGDRDFFFQAATRMLACSLLLIVPGVWYGRLGLRGVRDGTS